MAPTTGTRAQRDDCVTRIDPSSAHSDRRRARPRGSWPQRRALQKCHVHLVYGYGYVTQGGGAVAGVFAAEGPLGASQAAAASRVLPPAALLHPPHTGTHICQKQYNLFYRNELEDCIYQGWGPRASSSDRPMYNLTLGWSLHLRITRHPLFTLGIWVGALGRLPLIVRCTT
eukprot:6166881-Pyramimonas_sp.AAC.1